MRKQAEWWEDFSSSLVLLMFSVKAGIKQAPKKTILLCFYGANTQCVQE